jgi:hypothetical protein
LQVNAIDNSFYSKSRARANVVFPRGLAGTYGLPKLTKAKILESLDVYSTKLFRLIKRLKKGGLSFVYTNYVGFGGIRVLYKCLTAHGYKSYEKHGPGPKRFCMWTGETTVGERQSILKTFNSTDNIDGSQLQIVLGSPAISEGVTLKCVRHIHVLESYWNWSKIQQVLGRGSRFCSHKDLPKKDRTVNVYIYCAVTDRSNINKHNYEGSVDPMSSIDLYLLRIADKKKSSVEPLVELLRDVAVDKELYAKS